MVNETIKCINPPCPPGSQCCSLAPPQFCCRNGFCCGGIQRCCTEANPNCCNHPSGNFCCRAGTTCCSRECCAGICCVSSTGQRCCLLDQNVA